MKAIIVGGSIGGLTTALMLYLYMLEGKLDFMLAGADAQATPGDLKRQLFEA